MGEQDAGHEGSRGRGVRDADEARLAAERGDLAPRSGRVPVRIAIV